MTIVSNLIGCIWHEVQGPWIHRRRQGPIQSYESCTVAQEVNKFQFPRLSTSWGPKRVFTRDFSQQSCLTTSLPPGQLDFGIKLFNHASLVDFPYVIRQNDSNYRTETSHFICDAKENASTVL